MWGDEGEVEGAEKETANDCMLSPCVRESLLRILLIEVLAKRRTTNIRTELGEV